jgi:hypothetical protein
MKKYTFALVFAFLALTAVTPVLAGGGFEDYTLNPDGTVNVTGSNVATSTVTYDENGNIIEQGATAAGALSKLNTPVGIALAVVVLLIVAGLIYWSYKKSKPVINQ